MALPGQISVGSNAKTLLNGVTATTPVPATATAAIFLEAKGFKAYTFQVKGINTATVQLYASLDPALANVDPGKIGSSAATTVSVRWSILGAATTNDGFFSTSCPVIAVAAAVTAYTSGTIYVYAFAVP